MVKLLTWVCVLGLLIIRCYGQVATLYKANEKLPAFQNPFKRATIPTVVTIDFQFHQGLCVLKSGNVLKGSFRFSISQSNLISHYLDGKRLKTPHLEFNDPETRINFKDIRTLTLAGKDSLLPTQSKDSTFFVYSEEHSQLLRLNCDNGIQMYDELRHVDELNRQNLIFWAVSHRIISSTSMTGSISVSYDQIQPAWEFVDSLVYADLRRGETYYLKTDKKFQKLKKWSDIPDNFVIDSYIRNLADTLRKFDSRDIFFGLLFSYSPDKLKMVPFFRNIEITMEDGRNLSGKGFVQPSCYMGYSFRGIVHFYNGEKFTFFKPDEICKVIYEGREYIPVYDNWFKFWIMAFEWNYKGTQYLVSEEVTPLNNFYNYSDEYKHRIYEQKKRNVWKWVSGPEGPGLIDEFEKKGDRVTE